MSNICSVITFYVPFSTIYYKVTICVVWKKKKESRFRLEYRDSARNYLFVNVLAAVMVFSGVLLLPRAGIIHLNHKIEHL